MCFFSIARNIFFPSEAKGCPSPANILSASNLLCISCPPAIRGTNRIWPAELTWERSALPGEGGERVTATCNQLQPIQSQKTAGKQLFQAGFSKADALWGNRPCPASILGNTLSPCRDASTPGFARLEQGGRSLKLSLS